MQALRLFASFIVLGMTWNASAGLVCDNSGHCIDDPSITTESHSPSANSVPASVAEGNSNYKALDAAAAFNASGGNTGGGGEKCVSPYPDLPLTEQQLATCLAGVQRLQAAAQKKQQEEQPQQQQPPGGGGPPGGGQPEQKPEDQAGNEDGDQGGQDQGGGSECDQALKQALKECGEKEKTAQKTCDPASNPNSLNAQNGMAKGANRARGATHFHGAQAFSNSTAGASLQQRQYATDCGNDGQTCEKRCEKMIKKVQQSQACKKPEDKPKVQQAVAKLKEKKGQCEQLAEVAAGAHDAADSLANASDQGGANAAKGGGGLGDMMKALQGLGQKAQQDKKDQQQAAVDPCKDGAVAAGVPQLCICAPKGMSSQQCASYLPYAVAPVGLDSLRSPADVLRGPASEQQEIRTLPADITGP